MEEIQVNPQMAALTSAAVVGPVRHPAFSYDKNTSSPVLRIGLVLFNDTMMDKAIAAITSPISSCRISLVVDLKQGQKKKEEQEETNEEEQQTPPESGSTPAAYGLPEAARNVKILYGEEGFQSLLLQENDVVDAVYLIVPTEHQRRYTLAALNAKKHVLLNDPVSTSLSEFKEQLRYARKSDRFVQFMTLFVNHYHVQAFLFQARRKIGTIESMNAIFTVNYDDLHKVGVTLPLKPGQGCIRLLGRYCVLVSLLMLSRVGSTPVSVHCKKCSLTKEGVAYSAECLVKFSNNRVLTFHVAYSEAPTRQVLEVHGRDRYATMTDFVIPHPDGLSTLRIYDKKMKAVDSTTSPNQPKKTLTKQASIAAFQEAVHGESLDVAKGPPQDVMMWKNFAKFCYAISKGGWSQSNHDPAAEEAREVTSVALHTKRLLIALQQSVDNGCTEVTMPEKDDDLE